MLTLAEERELRVLDFDIENRPLSYWVPDMPTCDITSIASAWVGDNDSMKVDLLAPPCWHKGHEQGCPDMHDFLVTTEELLVRFVAPAVKLERVTRYPLCSCTVICCAHWQSVAA